jgi:hypothetical protein
MKISFPQNLFTSPPKDRVMRGKKIASNSKILFCGIARNVEQTLQKNIDRLNYIGLYFDEYDIFIYENDSNDDTKNIIQSSKISYICDNREDANYKDKINSGEDHNQYNRCKVLSSCRNKYLDYARKHSINFDYICILDWDIRGWSYKGFFDSMCRLSYNKIGSISAYGILSDFTNTSTIEYNKDNWLMYDSFAFRPLSCFQPLLPELQASFNYYKVSQPTCVRSNFGGMALYNRSILDLDYDTTTKSGYVDCDHVVINDKLSKLGYTHILNPYFVVSYSRHRFDNG